MKQSISVIIPAHNESENIERCLKSVTSWADEVMVLSSSSDDTDEKVKTLGATVVRFKHNQKFPFVSLQTAVNMAIGKTSCDWVLRLDADEVVTKELREEILDLLEDPDSRFSAYGIRRLQFFWGDFLKGGDWSHDRLIRLFKRESASYDQKSHVHEQLVVHGETSFLTHPLEHYSHPTLEIAIRKFNLYTSSEIFDLQASRTQAYFRLFFSPFYIFARWMIWNSGWKDGARGLVAAAFRSFYEFLLYAKYLEYVHQKSHMDQKDN